MAWMIGYSMERHRIPGKEEFFTPVYCSALERGRAGRRHTTILRTVDTVGKSRPRSNPQPADLIDVLLAAVSFGYPGGTRPPGSSATGAYLETRRDE